MKPTHAPSPLYVTAVATTGGLIEAITLGHPLEVLKTRMQATPHATIPFLYRAGGGIPGLYSGLKWSLVGAAARGGVRWTSYKKICSIADTIYGKEITPMSTAFVGTVSGITNGTLLHAFRRARVFVNTAQQGITPTQLVREEGVRWLWTGIRPSVCRSIVTTNAYAVGYDLSKHLFFRYAKPTSEQVEFRHALGFGAVCGMANNFLKNPLVVIEVAMEKSGAAREWRIGRVAHEIVTSHGAFHLATRGVGIGCIRSVWYAVATTTVLWAGGVFPERMLRWQ